MLFIPQELPHAYKLNGSEAPSRNAYKGHHVDDCGKAHGESTKKERLNGMLESWQSKFSGTWCSVVLRGVKIDKAGPY